MIINNILISDCKERLFSTVNVIKLNYPVMLTKGSPPNVGRYALGTIYYVHICPQGSMLSSSVIKRLNVFFRKQLQTLPTNHGANFFYYYYYFCELEEKKRRVDSPLPSCLILISMCFTTDLRSRMVSICHETGRGFIAHISASLPIYAALRFSDGTLEAKILLDVHWPGYKHGAKVPYSILGQCSLK